MGTEFFRKYTEILKETMALGRFEYWTEDDIEPEENIKLWHYIKDLQTGQVYEPDWSPYSRMNPEAINLFMELTLNGDEPTRQEAETIGPLRMEDLKKIAGRRHGGTDIHEGGAR